MINPKVKDRTTETPPHRPPPAGEPGPWLGREYAEVPQNTEILAAVKMTGKTESGLSLGFLESVTGKEEATIAAPAGEHSQTVEPLTNFFVGRMQKDLRDGDTRLGAMLTTTHRRLDDHRLTFLHDAAYTCGIDLYHSWHNKAWYVALNGAASRVQGDARLAAHADRLGALFPASRQRVRIGRHHAHQPRGTRRHLAVGRVRGAGWRFESGVAWRSPGFEINDVGFMQRADEVNQFTWVGWASRNPFGIWRRIGINGNQWLNWDFGGHPLSQQVNTNFNMEFVNSWSGGAGVTHTFERLSNVALRGGPSSLCPSEWWTQFWVNTDYRRRVSVTVSGEYSP